MSEEINEGGPFLEDFEKPKADVAPAPPIQRPHATPEVIEEAETLEGEPVEEVVEDAPAEEAAEESKDAKADEKPTSKKKGK